MKLIQNVKTSVGINFNFFSSSMKVLMFSRILYIWNRRCWVHFKTSAHILARDASRSFSSVFPVICLTQCKGRWNVSLCKFPHLKLLFPFLSHKCNEICEKSALLVSAPLPSPFSPSPTRRPSLPQHSLSLYFFLHSLWATLCIKACINIFIPENV